MKLTSTSVAQGVVGCLLMVLATGASAAEQVQFTRKSAVGEKWTISRTQTIDGATTPGQGNVPVHVQMTTKMTIKATVAIEEVDAAGKPTRATIVFDPACGGEISTPGVRYPLPAPVVGKTIVVTSGKNGLTFVEKNPSFGDTTPDRKVREQAEEMFTMDHTILPQRTMAVGETWKMDEAKFWELFPGDARIKGEGSVKLISVKVVDGRQVANVEYDMNTARAEGDSGSPLTARSAGRGQGTFDVQTSRQLSGGGPVSNEFAASKMTSTTETTASVSTAAAAAEGK